MQIILKRIKLRFIENKPKNMSLIKTRLHFYF